MSFETTANRRRPQTLDALAGQPFVSRTLAHALASERLAPAYLLSGPRGVGKTSTARILARCLNCVAGPTATPCGECDACQEIIRGNCLDVIEIDGASNTGVDDVRSIKNDVLYPPGSARFKVFIIDEVHMLSNSAFNALLKTIEEPPPYIVFIFATTEVQKLPATVRSRCQQFHFRLIEIDVLEQLLREACAENNLSAEDGALRWIAREAGGSLRDAYTLFDQVVSLCQGEKLTLVELQEKLGHTSIDTLTQLFDHLAESNFEQALQVTDELLLNGVPVEQLCVDLADYLHALLLLAAGVTKDHLLGHSADLYSAAAQKNWQPEQLQHALERCFAVCQRLRTSTNARFELDLLLNELSELRRYIGPARVLEKLQQLKAELGLAPSAPPPAKDVRPKMRFQAPELRPQPQPTRQDERPQTRPAESRQQANPGAERSAKPRPAVPPPESGPPTVRPKGVAQDGDPDLQMLGHVFRGQVEEDK